MASNYSNLPTTVSTDSAETTKNFFDTYYQTSISFPANVIDSTIAYFVSRGFDISAANTISATLLKQANAENINVYQLIETMTDLNELQLSRVVTEILNYSRLKTSILGYKVDNSTENQYEIRNILA